MSDYTDRQIAQLVSALAQAAALIERGRASLAVPMIKDALEAHRNGLASTAQIADFDFTVTSAIHVAGQQSLIGPDPRL